VYGGGESGPGGGQIRHVGFSTHGTLEVIEGAIATNLFEFVNLHYYLFFQRHRPAVDLAQAQDMGVFIISPGDKGGQLYQPPEALRQLCDPFEPLHLSYRWLLQDPAITTLSVGPANPAELAYPLQVADQTDALTRLSSSPLIAWRPMPIPPSETVSVTSATPACPAPRTLTSQKFCGCGIWRWPTTCKALGNTATACLSGPVIGFRVNGAIAVPTVAIASPAAPANCRFLIYCERPIIVSKDPSVAAYGAEKLYPFPYAECFRRRVTCPRLRGGVVKQGV
jgi:hypothetical protein